MNAGLMADLPSLPKCGALGVGLFRTELQFLIRTTVPKRTELAALYARILDAARDKPVVFRTLDIGSDKVLPYMKRADEPNPALGWRAIRVGLDRPGIMRMQVQALIRGAKGRPLTDHVPLRRRGRRVRGGPRARAATRWRASSALGHTVPGELRDRRDARDPEPRLRARPLLRAHRLHLGRRQRPQAVLLRRRPRERAGAPPLRHAERRASSTFLEQIVARCAAHGTPLSFCGEDAGRPLEALALAAIGFRSLSMRPASIGPVKALLRQVDLAGARAAIDAARAAGRPQRPPGLWRPGCRRPACHPDRRRPARRSPMINALTLLFFCQLAGEVAGPRARHHLPRPGARHGPDLRRPPRPRPLRPGARRRRRHASCATSRCSSCRRRSAWCSRPG